MASRRSRGWWWQAGRPAPHPPWATSSAPPPMKTFLFYCPFPVLTWLGCSQLQLGKLSPREPGPGTWLGAHPVMAGPQGELRIPHPILPPLLGAFTPRGLKLLGAPKGRLSLGPVQGHSWGSVQLALNGVGGSLLSSLLCPWYCL